MKLAVIGGGGVRAPLFVASALRRAEIIGLDEICLMDIDGPKLALTGALAQGVARKAGSPVRVTTTTDARAALDGASFVVTTIRVGGDEGRVRDERIALRYGVLGQETTGPGGFAMALRSIPAILEYARLRDELCPMPGCSTSPIRRGWWHRRYTTRALGARWASATRPMARSTRSPRGWACRPTICGPKSSG
ncbi:MAG: hypothetical protein Kow00106_24780 [Anaerolineae bacterium]